MVDEGVIQRRVEQHTDIIDEHEQRITRLERWRIEVRGALKVLAVVVGSGAVAYVADVIGVV